MARVEGDLVLGGRYRLVQAMAAGGMGTVWEAEDEILHRRVAVKVLADALAANETASERFRREARAAAGLSHPNVAGVFDFGEEDDGTQFMVMELIDGETLAERLRRQGRMGPQEAAGIAAQIADALQAAHDAGIVHRDVKPGNVVLTSRGEVKVLDFGIAAAATAPTLTQTGFTMGTAAYISPEQASGERATPASDVYSLGAVLYEMLSGRPPFTAESAVALAAAHASRSPEPLAALAPDLPEHLVRACDRAMAKDPADRPPSAGALAEMLRMPGPAPAATAPGTGADATSGSERTEALPPSDQTDVLPPSDQTDVLVRRATPVRPRWAFLGVLLVLAVLAVSLAHVYGPGPFPIAERIDVPPVAGQSRSDAARELRDAGFPIREVKDVAGPQGVVVRTDPPEGASLPPGTPVTLFVGSAPPPEEAPAGEDGHDKGKGKGKGGD